MATYIMRCQRKLSEECAQLIRQIVLQKRAGAVKNKQFSCYSNLQGSQKDASDLFRTDEVQGILTRITGMDLSKVFRHSKQKLEPPTYRLIGDTKLKELEEEAKNEAKKRLQMPPVLDEREEITDILSENPELEGLDSSKFVFTDITYGIKDRERFIVVREPSGTLRKATWEERDRITQIYFPRPYRNLVPPPLFDDENLSVMFCQDRHQDLLDAACVQFEPDAADFIRVHQQAYEDIDAKEKYDLLRSTRHFGGLVFYLTRNQRIDGMLSDMVQRNLISDGVDLVRLYHLLHPECQSSAEVRTKELEGIDIIKAFIATDAKRKGNLELVLQVYENERASWNATTDHQGIVETQR
ncbi:28S ribosomal protein S22, mitochondrial-like [Acanthaster planci]|uniref:28S ribosomal protein S22, mitochondrial-like n=1 Tax=Acanthaster planci TaxID=133434 RepID=A0A8B7YCK6_ACAPL|nr:28S ribosomal protein S22, mitochondrial-like [Acanthaster planci]